MPFPGPLVSPFLCESQSERSAWKSSTSGSDKHPSRFSTLHKLSSVMRRAPRGRAAALCFPLVARCSTASPPDPCVQPVLSNPGFARASLQSPGAPRPVHLKIFAGVSGRNQNHIVQVFLSSAQLKITGLSDWVTSSFFIAQFLSLIIRTDQSKGKCGRPLMLKV